VEQLLERQPAAFDNVASGKMLALPVRPVRFRAGADSVDVVLFMHAPIPSIRQAGNVSGPARVDFWMFPRDRHREYRDSAAMTGSGISRWIKRIPPSDYFYRIEATADGSLTSARAVGWFTAGVDTATGFSTRGFGVSDLLLATDARTLRPQPSRWFELAVAPVLESVQRGSNVHLVWENYELAAREGRSQYTLTVTLARQRTTFGRIAARVINALARAVSVDRQTDRVTYTFERDVAAAPAVVDLISLGIGDTPAGAYSLTVEIRDRLTGRTASTSTVFSIRN
jgi:hypothetical protein